MSSITPELRGDIKTGQDSFLLLPATRQDLVDNRWSRNFWVNIDKNKIWSATGVSKDVKQIAADKFLLEAGLLWHKITRANKSVGLKAEILSFVPASNEPVEIMQVTLVNISKRKISFIPTAAVPVYGRSADNLRDHRHVTSLLQRITLDEYGVIVRPTLVFNEAGHRINKTHYFVLGCDGRSVAPQYIYPTQEIFCGDAGDLEAPESILKSELPQKRSIQGREAMGALRFRRIILNPGQSSSYIILMGISEDRREIRSILKKFNNPQKIKSALDVTKKFWIQKSGLFIRDGNTQDFNNWMRWVSIQPVLRRIFGCSFLPDFDYGKGGRGWRDLWQDAISLILENPKQARTLLLNNFGGVRIDGTNATIILRSPGEFTPLEISRKQNKKTKFLTGFIADRNNLPRVWMDHGVWPLVTLKLYLQKTRDLGILFEQAPYFGEARQGTVLEHLLVQNLRQFYNVGAHNHVRLEGADWNDGLDMAEERGESVAFSCMYAANLGTLARLILEINKKKIRIAKELKNLLQKINYNSASAKRAQLKKYLFSLEPKAPAIKVDIDSRELAAELKEMSQWMMRHIRKKEWLKEGFFNGYYDNKSKRVEGRKNCVLRICLAPQVFAIMSGVATDAQIKAIMKNVQKYLFDKKLKGYRLNTDFKQELYDLGRAFSFAYGDKENGAIFNHMVVMYASALLRRGHRREAQKILCSIYEMAVNTGRSKIYPCLPEYFDAEGRGMYSYLTGSASWFLLASQKGA